MHLIGIEVEIHFYHVMSLKEKRRIINQLFDQIRNQFQISVSEIGELDSLSRSIIGFGLATNSFQHGENILRKVINKLDEFSEIEIIEIEWLEV